MAATCSGPSRAPIASSLSSGIQGGLCFGISLMLGGLFFARRMRRLRFTTLIDPFEARFGKRWARCSRARPARRALLERGAAGRDRLDLRRDARDALTTAILLSAVVVTAYTMLGGMWSVAYTDVFQLGLVALGLLVALPVAFQAVGGLSRRPGPPTRPRARRARSLLPPFAPSRGAVDRPRRS